MKSHCWWCTYEIEGNVLELPLTYNKKHDIYNCIGYFCSWECMKTYNLNDKTHEKYSRCSLITQMYHKMMKNNKFIHYAPPRECLERFGGNMSICDFRKNLNFNFRIIPNIMINNKLNIEKQVNYKLVEKEHANEQFKTKKIKQKIDSIKIKDKETNNDNYGILSFASFTN
jgi:hypothetical protein